MKQLTCYKDILCYNNKDYNDHDDDDDYVMVVMMTMMEKMITMMTMLIVKYGYRAYTCKGL